MTSVQSLYVCRPRRLAWRPITIARSVGWFRGVQSNRRDAIALNLSFIHLSRLFAFARRRVSIRSAKKAKFTKSTESTKSNHCYEIHCLISEIHYLNREIHQIHSPTTQFASIAESGRQYLRSAAQQKLIVPRCRRKTFGCRAFSMASPVSLECITGQSERSRADFRHFQASFEDLYFFTSY